MVLLTGVNVYYTGENSNNLCPGNILINTHGSLAVLTVKNTCIVQLVDCGITKLNGQTPSCIARLSIRLVIGNVGHVLDGRIASIGQCAGKQI